MQSHKIFGRIGIGWLKTSLRRTRSWLLFCTRAFDCYFGWPCPAVLHLHRECAMNQQCCSEFCCTLLPVRVCRNRKSMSAKLHRAHHAHHTGCANKNDLLEKIYICGIVAYFFTKFRSSTEEDSGHMSYKFRYNICFASKITTICM